MKIVKISSFFIALQINRIDLQSHNFLPCNHKKKAATNATAFFDCFIFIFTIFLTLFPTALLIHLTVLQQLRQPPSLSNLHQLFSIG